MVLTAYVVLPGDEFVLVTVSGELAVLPNPVGLARPPQI
jgi:hypothetical protein